MLTTFLYTTSLLLDIFSGASWITLGMPEPDQKRVCQIFSRSFACRKPVREATLLITALGLYEARINGKRVGKDYFSPGFTSYRKRLQYQAYSVKDLLSKQNRIEVLLGEGWYRGTFRNLYTDTANSNFGTQSGLLARIALEYTDGTRDTVGTDASWQSRESGIRYSEFYDGELFDAGFEIGLLKQVKLMDPYPGNLVPAIAPPVRKQEHLKVKKKFITSKNEQVFDFGQNLAGWVKLRVKGRKGDTLRVYHAEMLDSLGNFYTGNLRSAEAMDAYILSGGNDVLKPHFTYHGFRYIKIEGTAVSSADVEAVALSSDLKRTGSFSCSNPMLNQLQSNIEWSMKSNFMDIPTDCPQRSERLGWTGDAQVFAGTASFLRDTKSFYRKWLADVALEQGENGAVPNFVPTSSPYRAEFNGVAGWGDAVTIIPWTLFQVYGDTAVLREQYPMMKGWVDYISSVSKYGLFMNKGYGDWYAMGDSTSVPFINQCFYAHSAQLLVKAAKVLGDFEAVRHYGRLLDQVKQDFLNTYGKFELPARATQTAYVLALAFDLLPEEKRQQIADHLAGLIRANGNKLATGFLGTPHLLESLSRYGYADLAYALLLQKECPSWLYPITKGATTIWERWDAVRPDGSLQATSFNHYAYGAVGQWMYENILGIRPAAPGYEKVVIKPIIGGGLTWAKGSYDSSFGKIGVSWRLRRNNVILEVEVPKETTAEVYVPGLAKAKTVKFGKHRFTGILSNQQLFK